MIAGFIRHHLQEISKEKLIVAIILITILTMACEFFFGYHYGYVSLYWFNYNGLPFILSILVFVLVRHIYVPDSVFWNVLVKLAPYSFGVYLIHDQLMVRGWLWSHVPIISFCDQWIYPLVVLGLCILVFLSCAFVDSIRKKMFAWLGIDKLILKVDRWSFYS
jgi:peptidoglycan/LPS O-acetylase OafA/YrhL